MLLCGRFLWAALAWLALDARGASGQAQGGGDALNGPMSMPNLGRGFSLGALYNARTDERVSGFLWPLGVLSDKRYVKELNAKKAKYSMVFGDSFEQKSRLLEVDSELAITARAGAHGVGTKSKSKFKLSGSAELMTQSKSSSKQVRASVAFKLRTYQQVLDVFHPEIKKQLHSKIIADQRATHVVAGVTYGSDCIATFTYTANSLKEKTAAGAFLNTKMSSMGKSSLPFNMASAKAKTSTETEVSSKFDNMEFSTSSGITVDILGDVVPFANETLPTTVEEGIDFMKRLHQHGIRDGGVPMDLTLIPIAWLDSAAAKLMRKIDGNTIDEAFQIIMDLDLSLETLNELLDEDADGFIAWEDALHVEIQLLESFRNNVTQDISEAIDIFREGGDISLLTAVFQAYYASDLTLGAVQNIAEKRRDEIIQLKAIVSSLKSQAAVGTAESFSEFTAPSLDQTYDYVYILLLTGMNPARFRSSLSLVKDFTAYAASFLTSRAPTTWCRMAMVGDQSKCTENFHFGAIHFDSFCEHFCAKQYCNPKPHQCTDPVASAALSFSSADRSAWCQNPCTMILGFRGNQGPFRADTLVEVLPGEPTITAVTGADDVQDDPYRQKVVLHVARPARGNVTNWRVRTSWLELAESDSLSGWESKQHLFDTMEDSASIFVRRLTAGRKYTFEVAGINMIGVGPFSEEFRISGGRMLRIAYAMVTISAQDGFKVPRNNSGPGWKAWRMKALLSVPGEEPIGHVIFNRYGGGHSFECEELRGATTTEVTCLLPGPFTMTDDDDLYEVIVKNVEGDEIMGRSNFTMEAHTGQSCWNTEKETRVYCNATKMCVRSCSECMEIQIDSQGVVLKRNTTEVFQTHACLFDVCPDRGGNPSAFCPNVQSPFPCFLGSSTRDCRSNCHLTSVYHAPSGTCALPCVIDLTPPGLQQACTTVAPGETCVIGCLPNWVITNGNQKPVSFTCPIDNTQENYLSTYPAVSAPICAATCAIFTCPAGWTKNNAYNSRVSDKKAVCCDEVICPAGKWGPTQPGGCTDCASSARRRRSVSCTSCPSGWVPQAGLDDCQPYCNSITCPSGYNEKGYKATIAGSKMLDCCTYYCASITCPTTSGYKAKSGKDTRTGTRWQDCCDEVTCGAGQWRGDITCHTCATIARRRRSNTCTGCPGGGWIGKHNSDDCQPFCAAYSCYGGWVDKPGKSGILGSSHVHCCNEVVCGNGYYTRRRDASCDRCTGITRRRRATSCSGCPMNEQDYPNNDACKRTTTVGGYHLKSGDCTGGDISGQQHSGKTISWCASRCSGTWGCVGFNFLWSQNRCSLKNGWCSQKGGSYNTNTWLMFRKNR